MFSRDKRCGSKARIRRAWRKTRQECVNVYAGVGATRHQDTKLILCGAFVGNGTASEYIETSDSMQSSGDYRTRRFGMIE